MSVQWLMDKPVDNGYEQYLKDNAVKLYDGLVDKTLCSGAVVIR